MPKLKSFLPQLTVDLAQRSHACRYNKKHRIAQGQLRLTVKEGRDVLRYCPGCALKFVEADTESMRKLAQELQRALELVSVVTSD